MNAAIDFEKSIRHERLIYLGTTKQKMLHFLYSYIQGIFLLVINLMIFLFLLINRSQPLVAGLALAPVLPILISMALMNRLEKAEGLEVHRNQSEIFALLLRMSPGIQRHNCSPYITIITGKPRQFSLSKDIIILQDDEHVYMNIFTSRRSRTRYILFAIPNYLKTRAVLRRFSRRITEQSLQPVPVTSN